MEIHKSQCDGSVIRYQSTNLLQVKRAMIICLEKMDLARRDCEEEDCAKPFLSMLISMIWVIVTLRLHM